MPGRPRLLVGTFGAIQTSRLAPERHPVWTRFRDWDGQNRRVTSTASSRNAAITALWLFHWNRILWLDTGGKESTRY
jgi:hypothetical protein